MKTCKIILAVIVGALFAATSGYSADWKLPVQMKAGSAKTSVIIGSASTATDAYDPALDSPAPADAETLDAYIPHPEWNIVIGGKKLLNFYQDIRSMSAQTFEITVTSISSPVIVTWDPTALPLQARLMLVDGVNGSLIDMKSIKSYSLPITGTAQLIMVVEQPDMVAPALPTNLTSSPGLRTNSMQVTWAASPESDLAGYRIRIGSAPGEWERTVDVKNVLNYNLFDLQQSSPKYVALSAYDRSGNESDVAVLEVLLPLPPVNGICGSSSAKTFTIVPTTGLCENGFSSAVSGAGHPWRWSCSGTGSGSTSNCEAWIKTWSVIFSSVSGGTINGPVSQMVDNGADAAAVTAVAGSGYKFSGWSGTINSTANPLLLSGVLADQVITAIFTAVPPGTVTADGDVDGDGKITTRDVLEALRSVVGIKSLNADQLKHADLYPVGNPDGILTIQDAIVILRKAVGLML
jgi:hypothetical protein